jgi:hypothetical protein
MQQALEFKNPCQSVKWSESKIERKTLFGTSRTFKVMRRNRAVSGPVTQNLKTVPIKHHEHEYFLIVSIKYAWLDLQCSRMPER